MEQFPKILAREEKATNTIYVKVHLVKLLYVVTNAFFNSGNVASLLNHKHTIKKIKKERKKEKKRLPLDGRYINENKVLCSAEKTLREFPLPLMTIDQHNNVVIHIPH